MCKSYFCCRQRMTRIISTSSSSSGLPVKKKSTAPVKKLPAKKNNSSKITSNNKTIVKENHISTKYNEDVQTLKEKHDDYSAQIGVMEEHLQTARKFLNELQKANLNLQRNVKTMAARASYANIQDNLNAFIRTYQCKVQEIERTIDEIEAEYEETCYTSSASNSGRHSANIHNMNDIGNDKKVADLEDPLFLKFQTEELFKRVQALEKTNFDQKTLIRNLQASLDQQQNLQALVNSLKEECKAKDAEIELLKSRVGAEQDQVVKKSSESKVVVVPDPVAVTSPTLAKYCADKMEWQNKEFESQPWKIQLQSLDDEIKRIEAELKSCKD